MASKSVGLRSWHSKIATAERIARGGFQFSNLQAMVINHRLIRAADLRPSPSTLHARSQSSRRCLRKNRRLSCLQDPWTTSGATRFDREDSVKAGQCFWPVG